MIILNSVFPNKKDLPPLISQLNVFRDADGILRVGSKFLKSKSKSNNRYCPVLLSKESYLTKLVIREVHANFNHAGIYSCLSALKKEYWIPNIFSTVKKVVKLCVHCRRFNERTVKLNQSPYREFRMEPDTQPFSNIFIDYLGPFNVKLGSITDKVWILCITCLYTRAINLKVSMNMSTGEFLRSFSVHTFEYGVPQLVLSDLGTNFVSGANIIADFLNDVEVVSYFRDNGAKVTSFEHYYKGCSKLGSLVESLVKVTKRLIFGSIKNNVINVRDFEYLIAEVVHLANKRPIALLDSLRDSSPDVPEVITPELLLHGFDLLSVNLVPHLQSIPEDADWGPTGDYTGTSQVTDIYSKLRKVRGELMKIYNEEFLCKLINQATDKSSRYSPVLHKKLSVGDIVLIKEVKSKPSKYPMAVVVELQVNVLEETTGAKLRKANGEIVKRHASVIIPLLSDLGLPPAKLTGVDSNLEVPEKLNSRPLRRAAVESRKKTKSILSP